MVPYGPGCGGGAASEDLLAAGARVGGDVRLIDENAANRWVPVVAAPDAPRPAVD